YSYDANGNMTVRDGIQMSYDYRDRLISSAGKASFSYGEGYDRLTKTDLTTGGITYYPSQYFERHPEKEVKYIFAGSQKIAKVERELTPPPAPPAPAPAPEPATTATSSVTTQPTAAPTAQPSSDPAPSPTTSSGTSTTTTSSTSGGGGGGSYSSPEQLELMRLISEGKEAEARELSKQIYAESQQDQQVVEKKLVAGPLPENSFENLRVVYREDSAVIVWDPMPEEAASFKIYRSSEIRGDALSKTPIYLGEIKADSFRNIFYDWHNTPGVRYAYHVEALDANRRKLFRSYTLHSDQIFLNEDRGKVVDFRRFSISDFTHVFIKSNNYIDGFETSFPQRLILRPDAGLVQAVRVEVRFMECHDQPDGSRRCETLDNGLLEVHLIKKFNPLREVLAFTKRQVGRLVAALIPSAYATSDENTYYLLTDHLGSIDVVLDDQGQELERRDFLPYGSERTSTKTPDAPKTDHKFTGKELDDETGLHYYGARYYDSEIGRFTSVDPWEGDQNDPQTLNKYAYTLNNPLKYVDPTGGKVELVARETAFYNKAMHTFLRLTPDRPQDFGINHSFSFTIGGTADNLWSPLRGEINSKFDLNNSYEVFNSQVIQPRDPETSDTEFINAILDVQSRNEIEEYSLFSWGNQYNCNNYATTLLAGANANIDFDAFEPKDKFTYGWGEAIPSMLYNEGTMNSITEFEEKVLKPEREADSLLYTPIRGDVDE
ncbi:MAG: RHS repeat-associated core domain-containing protein, partial [Candidatus Peregrinibacteria bacterium]|nr:RHS repeat-associated core domain-containing protein [Candidatus Peregrinibacteria bacterium]